MYPRSPPPDRQAAPPTSLTAYWLAETLRLREAQWGHLEDSRENTLARAQGQSYSQKVLLRAKAIGRREGLDRLLVALQRNARIALAIMGLIAALAGGLAAAGALGDGGRAVNLWLALIAMLGFNTLAFALWLLSFGIRGDRQGTWISDVWLWLTQKLARGPDAMLAPRAMVELLGRSGSQRWLLGAISHGLWAIALACASLTMLALLSAIRYTFNWETTLLSPDTFVWLARLLGWLPSKLGFSVPPDAIIRASDGLQTLPASAQAAWSGWLIGCLIVYGLLPRLIALAVSLFIGRRRLSTLTIDSSLPGYAELRTRLTPSSETTGIDGPTEPDTIRRRNVHSAATFAQNQAILVGVELPGTVDWPPADLPDRFVNMGILDSRAQRRTLLERLHQHPVKQMLILYDGNQTPDRGVLTLIADLGDMVEQTHTAPIVQAGSDTIRRLATWSHKLKEAGFSEDQIHPTVSHALAHLQPLTQTSSNNNEGQP
jgi:hypothetical protein